MSENEEYLEETKLITEAFGDLFSKLKKRGFRDTYYFLSVAYEAYTHDMTYSGKLRKNSLNSQ